MTMPPPHLRRHRGPPPPTGQPQRFPPPEAVVPSGRMALLREGFEKFADAAEEEAYTRRCAV